MIKKSRVDVPENIEELLTLANAIYEKHQADGQSSPLNMLEEYNWNTIGPNLATALQKHKDAESLRRQSEKAMQERNILISDVDGLVKSTRNLLKALNSKSPKKLGDWGFDVTESAHIPKAGTETAK